MSAFFQSFRSFLCVLILGSLSLGNALAYEAKNAETSVLPMPSYDLIQNKSLVETFGQLPVQEDGRIKPLDTILRYKLLRISGKMSLRVPVPKEQNSKGYVKLNASQWGMLSMLHPDYVKGLKMFRVDNTGSVVAVGMDTEKERDTYSWNDLEPFRSSIFKLYTEHAKIDSKQRTPIERGVVALAVNLSDFEVLIHHFDFSKILVDVTGADLPGHVLTEEVKKGKKWELPVIELMTNVPGLLQPDPMDSNPAVRRQLELFWNGSSRTSVLTPPTKEESEWVSTALVGVLLHNRQNVPPVVVDHYEKWNALFQSAENFSSNLSDFSNVIVSEAKARPVELNILKLGPIHWKLNTNEYRPVPLEFKYYKWDLFYNAMIFFVLFFILLAFTWLSPSSAFARKTNRALLILSLIPIAMVVIGIGIRCVIQWRPPVATLYETIPFITAFAVILSMFAEYFTKRSVMLAIGLVLGFVGLMMAMLFQQLEGVDTMPTLQAVLITNFWLATHVVIVTIGYSAGLLATVLALVYVVWRLCLQIKGHRGENQDTKFLGRMTYGVICFTLLFSLVGTVLGGIWANYSWGRFWGWDPKENGALMIVLWTLLILHARLGGYIREWGMHVLTLMLGGIVIFSWFGVNLLGVGLHSYGFITGIGAVLFGLWIFLFLFIGLAFLVHALDHPAKGSSKEISESAAEDKAETLANS